MAEHPEDQEWLQRKVKPRFWANFLEQMERRGRQNEDEKEGEDYVAKEEEEEAKKGEEDEVEGQVQSGYV